MDEIAFTLFCFTTIMLVLSIGVLTYAVRIFEKSKAFMDYSWDLLHKNYDIPDDPEGTE